MSVFLDGALPHVGDLSHAETRRCGEFFSRKERKDHKAGGPTSVSATIDRPGWKRVTLGELVNLKTAVHFNAESQRRRVMQIKSEVLCGNEKYKNFSYRVNLHQFGVACMVL